MTRLFYPGPWCVLCGSQMVLREGQSFESFYGCRSYPDCSGTLPIDYEKHDRDLKHVKEIWRHG